MIAAGGTGGHFFPAEALAAELVARGQRVALMTDARSGGLASPAFAGRERFVLRGAGIAGRGVLRGAGAVASLARRHGAGAAACWRGCDAGGGGRLRRLSLASRRCWPRGCCAGVRRSCCTSRTPCWAAPTASSRAAPIVLALSHRRDRRACRTACAPASPATRCARRSPRCAAAPYAPPDGRNPAAGARRLARRARVQRRRAGGARARCPRRCARGCAWRSNAAPRTSTRVRAAYAAAGIAAELAPFFADVAGRLARARIW